MIYSNKLYEDIIFCKELDELEKEFPDRLKVIHTLTRETNEALFNDKFKRGRVSKEIISKVINDPNNTAVFACGPDHTTNQKKAAKEKGETLNPSYMGSVLACLDELGVPRNHIKKESYG